MLFSPLFKMSLVKVKHRRQPFTYGFGKTHKKAKLKIFKSGRTALTDYNLFNALTMLHS